MQDGINNRTLLLLIINELTLIRWTYIQEAIISSYSLFVIINVTLGDFANGYFHFFYL